MVSLQSECCYFETVKSTAVNRFLTTYLKCEEITFNKRSNSRFRVGFNIDVLALSVAFSLRKILVLIVFSSFLSSCSINTDEAFLQLETLHGNWKSEGNILVRQQWMPLPDSVIKGVLFSVNNSDTTFIEKYFIFKENDTLLLQLGKDASRPLKLQGSKARVLSFVNDQRSYPNRIILEWENDSIIIFKKENSRGNKPIEFRLKRE